MRNPSFSEPFRFLLLLIGDGVVFFISIAIALFLRHGFQWDPVAWDQYRFPFFVLFLVFCMLLALGDFYGNRRFVRGLTALNRLLLVFFLWVLLALSMFYILPIFTIAPKTILALHTGILLGAFLLWRKIISIFLGSHQIRFVLFGKTPQADELFTEIKRLKKDQQYRCAFVVTPQQEMIPGDFSVYSFDDLSDQLFFHHQITHVVVADDFLKKQWSSFFFFKLFPLGIRILDFSDFMEEVAEKIPVQTITTSWFLENFHEYDRVTYDLLKRSLDLLMALLLFLPASMLSLAIVFFILAEGKTKVFYIQNRVKKGGAIFQIYKFMTMIPDAEISGPQWASQKDPRVTRVGRVLRHLHLDEIPQFFNILKGDMSFIGPRPERPEFVHELQQKIPFYYQRFLVKPGLSGWAQLHYPYGASVEDALHKLQYELYYIKHRSLLFDLEVFLRSFRVLVRQPRR